MGIQIEAVDTDSAPESMLREMADHYTLVEAEEIPGDPPTPFAAKVADWRNVPAFQRIPRWILRRDGEIVAVAVAFYDLEQNVENGFGRVHVHPEHRGQGLGRAIAAPMLEHLDRQGCNRFDTYVTLGDPAESLVERLGLKKAIVERRSRLRIADLDHALMSSWIERATERAGDYDLVYYEVPFPEEIVQQFCDLTLVMNTAPRDDFEEEDEVLTPAMWRDLEQRVRDSKGQLHTLIAVHRPTGAYAGYTQLRTQDLQPDLAWQWDTGVHPDHRNLGLGRWLKAEMIERTVRDFPAVERVDTFNAGSNRPMLAINIEMGYEAVHEQSIWQGDLATVRERLGA